MSRCHPGFVVRRFHRVRGVALISVLIVVAVVSVSASWLMKSQHIAVQRTTRIVEQEQAILHMFGVENLVTKLLSLDNKHPDYYTTWSPLDADGDLVGDTLAELWSRQWTINVQNLEGFDDLEAFRNVTIAFCVQDANALLDINMLHRGLVENRGKSAENLAKKAWNRQAFMEAVLLNLFESSNLGPASSPDTPTPQQLLDSLEDWLDRDDAVRPEGAENSTYSGRIPPYQTAALRMAWPEEIYLVNGFRYDTAKDFMAVLTARPYSLGEKGRPVHSKININTAPRRVLAVLPGLYAGNDETVVLYPETSSPLGDIELYRSAWDTPPITHPRQLCSGMSPGLDVFCDPRNLNQGEKGNNTPYTFWSSGQGRNKYQRYLGAITEYFAAAIKVGTGGFENEMQVMLYRDRKNKEISVVQRRFGNGYYARCEAAKTGLVKGT